MYDTNTLPPNKEEELLNLVSRHKDLLIQGLGLLAAKRLNRISLLGGVGPRCEQYEQDIKDCEKLERIIRNMT